MVTARRAVSFFRLLRKALGRCGTSSTKFFRASHVLSSTSYRRSEITFIIRRCPQHFNVSFSPYSNSLLQQTENTLRRTYHFLLLFLVVTFFLCLASVVATCLCTSYMGRCNYYTFMICIASIHGIVFRLALCTDSITRMDVVLF